MRQIEFVMECNVRNPRQLVLGGTVAFVILLTGLIFDTLADETHWGYDGDEGPAFWAQLSSEFSLCADGSAQSPIDIHDARELDLVDIEFHYGETDRDAEATDSIYNNSHTIQVNVASGSYIVYNGIRYDLLQFHFHSPSEHTILGVAAPMEIHFVHQDPNSGNLAVVGMLLTEGESENEAYAAVFDHLPAEVGDPEAMRNPLILDTLLPDQLTFYTYHGSLTSPPCSEIVRWLLLDTALKLSAEQIAAFTAIYDHNARPVQPLGQRDLLQDSH